MEERRNGFLDEWLVVPLVSFPVPSRRMELWATNVVLVGHIIES